MSAVSFPQALGAVGAVHDSCKTVEFVGVTDFVATVDQGGNRGGDVRFDRVEFDYARIQRMDVFADILPPDGTVYADAVVLVIVEL